MMLDLGITQFDYTAVVGGTGYSEQPGASLPLFPRPIVFRREPGRRRDRGPRTDAVLLWSGPQRYPPSRTAGRRRRDELLARAALGVAGHRVRGRTVFLSGGRAGGTTRLPAEPPVDGERP